jgi:hypothetical protein
MDLCIKQLQGNRIKMDINWRSTTKTGCGPSATRADMEEWRILGNRSHRLVKD